MSPEFDSELLLRIVLGVSPRCVPGDPSVASIRAFAQPSVRPTPPPLLPAGHVSALWQAVLEAQCALGMALCLYLELSLSQIPCLSLAKEHWCCM